MTIHQRWCWYTGVHDATFTLRAPFGEKDPKQGNKCVMCEMVKTANLLAVNGFRLSVLQ